MERLVLRIISRADTAKEDAATVLQAAGYFRRHGVECEGMASGKEPLEGVRYASFIRDVMEDPRMNLVSDLEEGRLLGRLCEAFRTRDVIGVALSPGPLYRREGEGKRRLVGSGRFSTCAFLTTDLFGQLPADVRRKALTALTLHEVGHVLRDIEPHCEDRGCVMQSNDKSLEKFLGFAEQGLGFCRSCEISIGRGVELIRSGVLGLGGCAFDSA